MKLNFLVVLFNIADRMQYERNTHRRSFMTLHTTQIKQNVTAS